MSDAPADTHGMLQQVAVHFRLGMQGAGSEGLVTLIDRLLGEVQNAPPPPLQLNELSGVLGEVLAAQERRDLLYLADLLQFRLAPLIPRS